MATLNNFRAINIRLDSQGDYIPDGLIIKQGDVNGRIIRLLVTDYGTPVSLDGISAIMSYERPDKVSDIARFKAVGQYLECPIPEKVGAVAGNVLIEIQVQGADFIVGARNFILKCEKSPASYDKIINSNSYQDLLSIADSMMMLQNDANQLKTDAESTLKAQAERGEAIIAKEQQDFDDAQAEHERKFNASQADRADKYTDAEADRERRFQQSQTKRTSEHESAQTAREQDYQRWKSTIAGDAESRVKAKEQLFAQAQSGAELKWDKSLSEHEQRYQSSINAANAAKSKFDTDAANALQSHKSRSDEQFKQIEAIKESYGSEAALTTAIGDSRYAPKADFETLKETAATKSELDAYVKKADEFTKSDADKLYPSKSTATTSASGLMSASDKSKLDSVERGAQKNTVTSVNGMTGSVTIPLPSNATTSSAGLMSSSDKSKLDGVESGAERNTVTSVQGETGSVSFSNATSSQWGWMSAADKRKLDGIQSGAQQNPDLSNYVTKSKLTDELLKKANTSSRGGYVESSDVLQIKVVSSLPSYGERNTLYLVKE